MDSQTGGGGGICQKQLNLGGKVFFTFDGQKGGPWIGVL